ncbi:MAG: hypothetical protein K0S84_1362 [Nitrososphaera sp.]|jgi:hypothetical protein|nr:hypothetical protein [Nitrososphaera sp.]
MSCVEFLIMPLLLYNETAAIPTTRARLTIDDEKNRKKAVKIIADSSISDD